MCTPSDTTVLLLLLLLLLLSLSYYWLLVPASRAHHQNNIYKKIKNAGAYSTKTVSIANDYGLKGPGSNSGADEFSARPDRPWGPPNLL